MTLLQVISTTDGQWLGVTMPLAEPARVDYDLHISPGIRFRIKEAKQIAPGLWRFSNPHYVAIAKEVG